MGASEETPPGQGFRWAGLRVVWLELYFSQSPFPSLLTMELLPPLGQSSSSQFSNHPEHLSSSSARLCPSGRGIDLVNAQSR